MARRNKKVSAADEASIKAAGEVVAAITADQETTEEQKETVVIVAEPTIDELKARVAELEGQLAAKQNHILWTSAVQKPVALVREIFCQMYGSQRKDVIAACVNRGIAANTAKTQYQILKGKAERGELEELLEEGGESEE